MADFRCANPADQLDVDTMMVEYAVYQAVDAKLKAVKAELSQEVDETVKCQTAEGLIENFDVLLRLFKHHHPTANINEGANYNIKVLEFLVLFSLWIQNAPSSAQLCRERNFNSKFRQIWLESRKADQTRSNEVDVAMEPEHGNPPSICLYDILLRFMDLSAEISHSMGCVNEQWYKLAAELMLQCSLERMRAFDREHRRTRHVSAQKMHDSTIECFAWGTMNTTPSSIYSKFKTDTWTRDRIEEQLFICDLFKPDEANDNSTHDEDPTWTIIRSHHLTEALNLLPEPLPQTTTPPLTFRQRLRQAESSHPLDTFCLGLCDFIEGLWCLNVDSISGKPILVQIEEGGIDGLSPREFDEFLGRVGLKEGLRWAR